MFESIVVALFVQILGVVVVLVVGVLVAVDIFSVEAVVVVDFLVDTEVDLMVVIVFEVCSVVDFEVVIVVREVGLIILDVVVGIGGCTLSRKHWQALYVLDRVNWDIGVSGSFVLWLVLTLYREVDLIELTMAMLNRNGKTV